jgi:hypothetical protein
VVLGFVFDGAFLVRNRLPCRDVVGAEVGLGDLGLVIALRGGWIEGSDGRTEGCLQKKVMHAARVGIESPDSLSSAVPLTRILSSRVIFFGDFGDFGDFGGGVVVVGPLEVQLWAVQGAGWKVYRGEKNKEITPPAKK